MTSRLQSQDDVNRLILFDGHRPKIILSPVVISCKIIGWEGKEAAKIKTSEAIKGYNKRISI